MGCTRQAQSEIQVLRLPSQAHAARFHPSPACQQHRDRRGHRDYDCEELRSGRGFLLAQESEALDRLVQHMHRGKYGGHLCESHYPLDEAVPELKTGISDRASRIAPLPPNSVLNVTGPESVSTGPERQSQGPAVG
jgi:hypothetical protein